MAKKITLEQAVDAFRLIADYLEQSGGLSTSAESGGDVEKLNEDDVRALGLKELRELAVELGLDERVKKAGILDEMVAKGLFEESDEDEDEEDDDEADEDEGEDDTSDEDEDEEEEISREELEDMDLAELRKLAKSEGLNRADYIKADKDTIIDLLLGEEEEDDDEDDEDEDGDTEELNEEEIRAMSLNEVKALAKELGVKIPAAIQRNRKKIADKILDEMAE